MRKQIIMTTFFSALLILAVSSPALLAQGGPGHGGQGGQGGQGGCGQGGQGHGNGEPYFDPATVTTLQGRLVASLGLWAAWGNGNHTGNGMHYRFESDDGETFYAMLGPWWYLEDNGIALENGLEIEITGSVVEPYWDGYDDLRYLIASEVAVGDVRVTLRDEDGYPVWHGTGWHYYAPAWTLANRSVTGTIRSTRTRTHGGRLDPGYEVVLRSGGRNYVGFLAPQWYVEMRRLGLAAGDWITLHGAYTRENGRHEIVVRAVDVNGRTYRLRNNRGVPFWIHGAR